MYRNLFLILTNIKPVIDEIFSAIKFNNRFQSFIFGLFSIGIIAYITKNTEFSIFNEEMSLDKIGLWVTIILSLLSNHDENNKEK